LTQPSPFTPTKGVANGDDSLVNKALNRGPSTATRDGGWHGQGFWRIFFEGGSLVIVVSLLGFQNSLFGHRKFPVQLHREIGHKSLIYPKTFAPSCHSEVLILRISLLFSLLAGNRDAETGSTATASATTQSHTNRDFLKYRKMPTFSGLLPA
jgi:hypothetical protein